LISMRDFNESFSSLATYDTADSRTTDHFLHAWTTSTPSNEIKRNKKEPEPLLAPRADLNWSEPVASPTNQSRNKETVQQGLNNSASPP
jgi:hypothetical protein